MTKEKKVQFGGWTRRDWRDIRAVLYKEWLEGVLDEIEEKPPQNSEGDGYIEPTRAIRELG